MLFYRFARLVCRIALHLAFHIQIEGLENLPKEGGYILCANHTSYLDPPLLGLHLDRNVHFMAKEELFHNRLFAWLIRKLGAFPVERGKGGEANPALQKAIVIVGEGQALALFPEGTRSKTGKPLRPKSGIVLIAAQTGADIVPAGISIHRPLRFRTRITVRYGEPIPNASLGITGTSPQELKQASRTVMDAVIGLLDEGIA